MNVKTNAIDVGVIIARFQVHKFHPGQMDLIKSVKDRCGKVIIFLGLAPLKNSFEDPLDFQSRKTLVFEEFPDIDVYYVEDQRDDGSWSKNIDAQIRKWTNPNQSVTLFGSRDSFISHYKGNFPVLELEATTFTSGTEVRRRVCNNYPRTADYRAGVIAATASRYPTVYTTVDVAIVNNDARQLLLVRKPNERKYRFVGGFADVKSPSFEVDARRETFEETGLTLGNLTYIGSTIIDDWRYPGRDKIKTLFWLGEYSHGRPEGQDDVAEARWFNIADLTKDDLVSEHGVLFDLFVAKYNTTKPKPGLKVEAASIVDATMP